MTTIVTTNAQLREILPSQIVTVQGEMDLFTKIRNHLLMAESDIELLTEATNLILQHDNLLRIARRYVGCVAIATSINKLDIVLTPNGFGIVSTNSIAPANIERVDRLRLSLLDEAHRQLQVLVRLLGTYDEWCKTETAAQLRLSALQRYEFLTAETYKRNFTALCIVSDLTRTAQITNHEVRNIMGEATYHELSALMQSGGTSNIFKETVWLLLKQIVLSRAEFEARPDRTPEMQQTHEQYIQQLRRDMISYMTSHSSVFPLWEASSLGQSYLHPKTYNNTPQTGGYWM